MGIKLNKVAGIGSYHCSLLNDAGFTTVKQLNRASVEELCAVHGIGQIRAAQFKDAAEVVIQQKKKKEKAKKLTRQLAKTEKKKKAKKKAKKKR